MGKHASFDGRRHRFQIQKRPANKLIIVLHTTVGGDTSNACTRTVVCHKRHSQSVRWKSFLVVLRVVWKWPSETIEQHEQLTSLTGSFLSIWHGFRSCVMHSLGVADRDPEETLFYFEHVRAR